MKKFSFNKVGLDPVIGLDLSGMLAVSSAGIQGSRWSQTEAKLKNRISGFYDAPVDEAISQINESIEAAKKFKSNAALTDCVFIGIGGSALGPISMLDALKHKSTQKINIHFFENPDPLDWSHRIKKLKPISTLICVVTKSGTTYETLALFMLAFDWLIKDLGEIKAAKQVIAITDPTKGELREFCQVKNISCLSIHPSVGGRYSIFTPVGLFLASLVGLDANQFLSGAKMVRENLDSGDSVQALESWCQSLMALNSKHPIHVMMPYSTPLRWVANWWVQLWAESLGKDGKGFTPIAALGATDQHSVLQLLRDGPDDKIIWFVSVKNFGKDVVVPSIGFDVASFDLLKGQSLNQLLTTEFQAIEKVMKNQKRPCLVIELDEINEKSVGALMFTFCALTALMGDYLGVDPFDQPGVEEGKIYIRDRLLELKAR